MNMKYVIDMFERLNLAHVNSGGFWFSRPSERVSPRRD